MWSTLFVVSGMHFVYSLIYVFLRVCLKHKVHITLEEHKENAYTQRFTG